MDLTQDSEDRYRFRTNVFPNEYPPIIYVALDDDEASKGNYHTLHVLKSTKPKLRRAIISAGGKEMINSINECVLGT